MYDESLKPAQSPCRRQRLRKWIEQKDVNAAAWIQSMRRNWGRSSDSKPDQGSIFTAGATGMLNILPSFSHTFFLLWLECFLWFCDEIRGALWNPCAEVRGRPSIPPTLCCISLDFVYLLYVCVTWREHPCLPLCVFPLFHSSFNTPLSLRQSILTSAACEHPNLVSFPVGKKWIYASSRRDLILFHLKDKKKLERILTCRKESRPLTGCIIHGCLINNSASDVCPAVAWWAVTNQRWDCWGLMPADSTLRW